jgi:hypothetical protein
MNTILVSVISGMRLPLQGALTLFICVIGWLVMNGDMSPRRASSYAIRAVVIAYLLSTTEAYGLWVRDRFFTTIPNEITRLVVGSAAPLTAAQQFDNLSLYTDTVIASALGQATSLSQIGDRVALWWADTLIHLLLAVEFFIFLLGRKLMAIVIVIGPFLLLFELFEATRGYCRSWVGKLVGLTVFQLASTSLLVINAQGAYFFVQNILNNPPAGLSQQIANIDRFSMWCLGDALAMLALPSVVAIGSGAAAGSAVATTFLIAAGSKASGLAGRGARAVGRFIKRR